MGSQHQNEFPEMKMVCYRDLINDLIANSNAITTLTHFNKRELQRELI